MGDINITQDGAARRFSEKAALDKIYLVENLYELLIRNNTVKRSVLSNRINDYKQNYCKLA